MWHKQNPDWTEKRNFNKAHHYTPWTIICTPILDPTVLHGSFYPSGQIPEQRRRVAIQYMSHARWWLNECSGSMNCPFPWTVEPCRFKKKWLRANSGTMDKVNMEQERGLSERCLSHTTYMDATRALIGRQRELMVAKIDCEGRILK